MKRIFYHMACWLAVLGCAACSNEADFVKTEADIVLCLTFRLQQRR